MSKRPAITATTASAIAALKAGGVEVEENVGRGLLRVDGQYVLLEEVTMIAAERVGWKRPSGDDGDQT